MEHLDTSLLELKLTQCENWQELEGLMRKHQRLYVSWKEHLRPMIRQHHLSYKKIAAGCGVSETTARNFIDKIPIKRDNVIMLAMMMSLSVEETNDLLMRWGRYQKLYPRNPSDAIWIYLLTQGGSDQPKALFRSHFETYKKLKADYCSQNASQPIATEIVFNILVDQAKQAPEAAETHVSEDFRAMVWRLLPAFENGYWKLLDYINSFFRDMEAEDVHRLGLETDRKPRSGSAQPGPKASRHQRKITANEKFKDDKSWLEAYYRKIRKLETEQIMPDRAFLVALGLRMNMNADQINHMLDLAGMGPLCAKDPLEGALVFALEDLYCTFPSCFDDPGNLLLTAEYDLMDYCADYDKHRLEADPSAVIFDIPDIAVDYEDNPVETVYEFMRRAFQEHDVSEFGCDDYIHELFSIPRSKK